VALRFFRCSIALSLLLAPVPVAARWIDVPFIPQRENGCGAAATAMVMQYWGAHGFGVGSQAADAAAIYDSLYSTAAKGILGSRIEGYLRAHGFESYVFAGSWEDLSWHIARGRPLIVCVRGGGRGAPLHYLVVAGVEERQGTVIVNDSARRKLNRVDRASFERDWRAAGNWTLLALPRQDQEAAGSLRPATEHSEP
jgi:ABC-type bacteriocin/lantibiotic exporter with double-glycine peptidase domain